ncbi:protein S-acyltransferase 13-like [Homarus americanus]|uniref:Palmitoyltransferase n=1 Tax=Homarus americanus TaxID=6706 RepID=A0A8J5MKA4_HOMAM|nr:protein S-acyltransferase 13-like [Homarus americanus]
MENISRHINKCQKLSPDLRVRDRSIARRQLVYSNIVDKRTVGWMVSPLCVCRRAWSSFINVDKIMILRRLVDFLTSLAPLTTLVIIVLLSYYSYQLMEASGVNTVIVYFFIIEIFGNWLLFFFTKSYIDKSSGNSELAPGLSHDDCRQLRYCPTCNIYKPERSHHCSLCDRCIHQRDHHCFFLGTCIYSARLLHHYYSGTYLRTFLSSEFMYYFYPFTLVMWLLGKGLLMVHRSAFHNFLHVFGRYWILNILIPFPRRHMATDPRSFLKIV